MSSFSKNNIILVGFMGVGKTTIGHMLALKVHLPFVDLDECVVKLAGCSITQLFEQCGEQTFRDLETKALAQLDRIDISVVSTGGGIIGRTENWDLMKQLGHVVYLHADWPTLVNRLVDTTQRPLAENGADKKLRTLWENRLPFYRQADVIVNTDNLTPEQVVDEILLSLNVN